MDAFAIHDPVTLAQEYNQVRFFTEQQHTVDESALIAAGAIFVKHAVHLQYGVALLHRHNKLPTGFGMIHTNTNTDADLCTMQPLPSTKIRPHTLFLNSANKFSPLEYTTEPTTSLAADFLADFGAFLTQANLRQLLGITLLPQTAGNWLERELTDQIGTIAVQVGDRVGLAPNESSVTTAWKFLCREDGMEVVSLKDCVRDPSGGHKT